MIFLTFKKNKKGSIPYESNLFGVRNHSTSSKRGTRDFRSGFTLVETLVAISILLIAVVAPLSILAGNIRAVVDMKNKITALYLAEDAIDFVKYRIATNFNNNNNWLAGLDSCIQGGIGTGPCYIDSYNDTDPIVSCSGTCATTLKFNPTTGTYEYISGIASLFMREVSITPVAQDPNPTTPSPDEVVITTTVSWQERGVTKNTILSEHAFSWR